MSCACLMAWPATAAAEWHITPMLGLTFAGKTTLTDLDEATGKVHPNVSISGALLGGGLIGAEAIATLTPGFFQTGERPDVFQPGAQNRLVDKSRLFTLMGNLVVTAPRRWTEYNLRPFVSGGFGLMRISKQEALLDVFSFTENLVGYNIGGGAVGFLSRNTGVRFDFRYYSTVHGTFTGPIAVGDIHVRYMTASIGLVFRR